MIFARHSEQTQAAQTQAERFQFRHWSAAGPLATGAEPVASLDVTDIVISPDDSYGFDVMAGPRRVISFFFDNLEDAAAAARELKALLPSVRLVLRDGLSRKARPVP